MISPDFSEQSLSMLRTAIAGIKQREQEKQAAAGRERPLTKLTDEATVKGLKLLEDYGEPHDTLVERIEGKTSYGLLRFAEPAHFRATSPIPVDLVPGVAVRLQVVEQLEPQMQRRFKRVDMMYEECGMDEHVPEGYKSYYDTVVIKGLTIDAVSETGDKIGTVFTLPIRGRARNWTGDRASREQITWASGLIEDIRKTKEKQALTSNS